MSTPPPATPPTPSPAPSPAAASAAAASFIATAPAAAALPSAAASGAIVVFQDGVNPSETPSEVGSRYNKEKPAREQTLDSLKDTAQTTRNNKRNEKLKSMRATFPLQQTQTSLQAASTIVVFEGKTVVDAKNFPVTQARLDGMILKYAKDRNLTPQEATDKLNAITNVHDFAKSFIEETVDGWQEDEDIYVSLD